MSDAHLLNIESLVVLLIIIIYITAPPLFERYHFHYMHESGLCMLIGLIATLLATVVSHEGVLR